MKKTVNILSITLAFVMVAGLKSYAQSDSTITAPKKPKKTVMSIYDFVEETKMVQQNVDSTADCVIDYPKVRKQDITKRKRIVRDIYFAENINKPLFSVDPNKNVMQILIKEFLENKVDLYEKFDFNDGFGTFQGLFPVEPVAGSANLELNLETFGLSTALIRGGAITPELYEQMIARCGLRVVEDWYLDVNLGEYKPFIVALGFIIPSGGSNSVRMAKQPESFEVNPESMIELFWINYPTSRAALCKYKYFNKNNDQFSLTLDDVFQLRYFTSVVVGENDGTGELFVKNTKITNPFDKLNRSEEIKRSIIKNEQDLWSY